MGKVSALLLVLLLSGCGTVNGTFRGDHAAARTLEARGTYCSSLLRIYGGLSYDFCVLHAEPGYAGFYTGIPYVFLDMVVSGVVDTLVLPYTLVMQYEHGNIEIDER